MIHPKTTTRVLFVSVFVLFSCTVVFSQSPGIKISRGSHISTDKAKLPHVEPFLAVNPKDPNHWIATAILNENSGTSCYPYVSHDGGRTWKRGQMKNKSGEIIFKTGEDPLVYFDPDGKTAFFGTISASPRNYVVSRSTDGGLTWEDPVTIPGGVYDRPYIAFDASGGKFNNRIYSEGALFTYGTDGTQHNMIGIVSSDDGGRTFFSSVPLDPNQGDRSLGGIADLLVTSSGKLVVPFGTYVVPDMSPGGWRKTPLHGNIWIAISENGGVSFLPPLKGPSRSHGTGFWALASGITMRAAIGAPNGPYKDRIYLVWEDYDGKKYMVKEAYSKDLGKSWSTPAVVNDNTNEGAPANPAIAVNKDGIVAVTFNDRRDDPKSSCFQLYLAVSVDGGKTFLPNVKASEKPTCPAAQGNWTTGTEAEGGPFPFSVRPGKPYISLASDFPGASTGGDTQGLVADSSGAFDVAWINGETGVMQLWSKNFTVDRAALPKQRKDLSHDLKLNVSEPVVNLENHAIAFKVRLENLTSAPIEGPFTVVLDDNPETIFKDLHVVDADNGLSGRGAMWNFTAGRQKTLAPKQESDVREFHWVFNGGLPEQPDDIFTLLAHFRILGPAQH